MLAGLKLLLVDDDASVRLALHRLLKRAGAIVKELDPFGMRDDDLVHEICGCEPDVILMDVHLGDRGGISVWRQLVTGAPELAPRVAFVTGLVAGDSTWIEADSTGQPVLGKPFDLPQLMQTLTRLRSND